MAQNCECAKLSEHVPVMVSEVMDYLLASECRGKQMVIVDCTLGGGGHAHAMLAADENLFVIGFDKDNTAIEKAKGRFVEQANRVFFVNTSFEHIDSSVEAGLKAASSYFNTQITGCHGVLADLGISSDQLNDPDRGFAFSTDGPLDMRMDKNSPLTAWHVVNEYSYGQLHRVFMRGGMRGGVKNLVRAIVSRRPINSTKSLKEIIEFALHFRRGAKGAHPATVAFQAVRIEVNKEFEVIEEMLPKALDILLPGGRLAIICFHSLEDACVTRMMRAWARPEEVPRGLPIDVRSQRGILLTKQAVLPSEREIELNPRARSARLRVFSKQVVV